MTARRRTLLVVSNRGPVGYDRDAAGERIVRRGAGGLVTALRGLLAHHDVTWIASATTAEERVLAAAGPLEEVARDGSSYRLRFVEHDPVAYDLFYNVVANPALWFVQHGLWDLKLDPGADLLPAWEQGYVPVNAGFASAVAEELERVPDAAVFFHDYHLYVAPLLLRARCPEALTMHFIHIPWVAPDAWRVLPEPIVKAVHAGLCANDVVGFHTERWRSAFLDCVGEVLGPDAVGETIVTAHPISVDVAEFDELRSSEPVLDAERELLASRPEYLILRVDRTDPSKNTVRGLEAYGLLLERRPDLHGRVELHALLDPSRQSIPEYAAELERIERAAAAIELRFGRPDWQPLHLRVADDFAGSVAAYKQFDVLLVNAIMDGLNLVAKEAPFVNERDGVLVLSRQTGAFDELGPFAVPVDPFDVEGQADALELALELAPAERHRRRAAIEAQVREHDLAAWLDAVLSDLDRASTIRA